ncbi:hypothetical protein P3W85_31980, partial [Cupriavidus basilensis]|nr:hypothetical protein [Cupriavidus basilensis]
MPLAPMPPHRPCLPAPQKVPGLRRTLLARAVVRLCLPLAAGAASAQSAPALPAGSVPGTPAAMAATAPRDTLPYPVQTVTSGNTGHPPAPAPDRIAQSGDSAVLPEV